MINKPVPRFTNPADFFMKILSVRYPKSAEDDAKIEFLVQSYQKLLLSSIKAENKQIKLSVPVDFKLTEGSFKRAGTCKQFRWLFFRSWILAKREPRLGYARIMQTMSVAIFMMVVFHGLGHPNMLAAGTDGFTNCRSLTGAIYFTTVCQMFINFVPTVVIFQNEKPLYVRERDSGLYSIWVYATTKLIAELPITLFVPLLLNAMIYWVIDFEHDVVVFLQFYLILVLMLEAVISIAYFVSSLFSHETTAVAFAPIVNLLLNMLGGFMISLIGIFQQTPQKYIAWISYISPVRWGF
jgi:ABC-2 type transporter